MAHQIHTKCRSIINLTAVFRTIYEFQTWPSVKIFQAGLCTRRRLETPSAEHGLKLKTSADLCENVCARMYV